jgi:HlyD family secretion protein
MDEIRKNVDLADAQLRSAIKQSQTALPNGSDHALAVAALAEARSSADAARSRLRYATIAAPVAGTLISRAVEAGDVVQSGKALMVLSPQGDPELVAQIDEKNLQLLAVGQPAQASADAYARKRFEAQLVFINPGVDAQRGSVEVKLSVPHPPDYLRQDMTVSIDIQVASRKQAVLLASDALRDVHGDRAWVLKVDGGRARRRDVRLGLHSGGMAEIVDGLVAGDRVVPAAAPGLRANARLRPVAGQCQAATAG